MSAWTITHNTDTGGFLRTIERDVIAFSFTRVLNDVGRWFISLPADGNAVTDFGIDNIIQFDRKPDGGKKSTEFIGFVRGREQRVDGNGNETINIWGPCLNYILGGRIVAYAAGTSYASKTDNVDDIVCAVARENIGSSSTDATRSLASYITIAPDAGLATSITKSFAWQNIGNIMQGLAKISQSYGTDLYFGFDSVGADSGIRFATKTGYWGIDRSSLSSGLSLSRENENLAEPYYTEDYESEVNYVYAGGNNTGADRYISETFNANRLNGSIWARREAFQDARGQANASVDAAARQRLFDGLPIARVGGRIVETDRFRYGVEWGFGDRLNVNYVVSAPGVVNAVAFSVSGGIETIEAKIDAKVFDGSMFRAVTR